LLINQLYQLMQIYHQLKYFFIIILLPLSIKLSAEGTKEIMPTSTDKGRIHLYKSFSDFAHIDATEPYRLHINIQATGEIIYFGFGTTIDPMGGSGNDVSYRLMKPDGTIALNLTSVPTSGAGFIDSYNKAVVGPKQFPGASTTGYNAIAYTATMTGDYYMEFDYSEWSSNGRREFTFFDITVGLGNTKKLGRVWSKAWQFTATNEGSASSNQFKGSVYVYADDGIVTKVNFNGFQPIVFNVFCNPTGVVNTGNFVEDRKSTNVNQKNPQYKIFLNDPDLTIYPTGAFGIITGAVTTFSYCDGGTDIFVPVNKAGRVELLIEANPAAGIQPVDRQIFADVVPGTNTIHWDGLNGLGQPLTSGSQVSVQATYLNGLTNLPLWDPDVNNNGFKVSLIRPTGPQPAMFWDDSNIFGTSNLTGCTATTGCHTFGSTIGNDNTINTWWYANSTTSAPVTFTYRHTYYGSSNQTLCEGDSVLYNGVWVKTAGVYSNTVLNMQGCDSTTAINLTLIPKPTVTLPPDEAYCIGGSTTLDAGSGTGYTYFWTPGGATTQSITVNTAGTYTVRVTAPNGCFKTDDFTLTIHPNPPGKQIKHY